MPDPTPPPGGNGTTPGIVTLVIKMDVKARSVTVEGQLNEKGMCYMMLEMARDAIKSLNDDLERKTREELEKKKIEVVNLQPGQVLKLHKP